MIVGNFAVSKLEFVTKQRILSGADPGILVRGGGVDFSFKGMGFEAALRPPGGKGHGLGGAQGGEAPGSSGILVILGVNFTNFFNLIR